MQPMPGTADEMAKKKSHMRALMDRQRIEVEGGHGAPSRSVTDYCSLCGGHHDERHCVEDVIHGIVRATESAPPRYPAKLIPPGVSGGDLAQKRRIINVVGGPIRVGARFESCRSGVVFVVTAVKLGQVVVRRGANRVMTSVSLLANPRKWRRVG